MTNLSVASGAFTLHRETTEYLRYFHARMNSANQPTQNITRRITRPFASLAEFTKNHIDTETATLVLGTITQFYIYISPVLPLCNYDLKCNVISIFVKYLFEVLSRKSFINFCLLSKTRNSCPLKCLYLIALYVDSFNQNLIFTIYWLKFVLIIWHLQAIN